MTDQTDNDTRECWELSREEQIIVETYRTLGESQREAVWQLLSLIYRARREAAAEG
jgi:hypothetical protein